jgi:hypothetical protein
MKVQRAVMGHQIHLVVLFQRRSRYSTPVCDLLRNLSDAVPIEEHKNVSVIIASPNKIICCESGNIAISLVD